MLINRIGILAKNYRQINPCRSSSTAGREKLLADYRKFQMDDGIPVYLKGGFMDKMLFQTTVVLIICGIINGGMTLYSMAKPKKKK